MCCSLHDLRVDVSVLLHHVFHNVWKDHEETYHYILVIWFPTHSSEHQTLLRMYTTQSDKDYNKDFLTHVTQLFSHSVFTVNAAVPARRTGIFFWSFTKKYCTTSAVCKSYRQDVFIKTLKITLWISACVCVCGCYLLVDLCRCDFLQPSLNLRRTWLSECCVIIFFLSQNHSQKDISMWTQWKSHIKTVAGKLLLHICKYVTWGELIILNI